MPEPPRPPERIGDHDRDVDAGGLADRGPDAGRRGIGVVGQQGDDRAALRTDVRGVDRRRWRTRSRARVSVMTTPFVHAHDALRVAQHDLHLAGVAIPGSANATASGRGLIVRQVRDRALCLRDDLLGDDQHVVVPARGGRRASPGGVHHELGEVVARSDLRDALERDDLEAGRLVTRRPGLRVVSAMHRAQRRRRRRGRPACPRPGRAGRRARRASRAGRGGAARWSSRLPRPNAGRSRRRAHEQRVRAAPVLVGDQRDERPRRRLKVTDVRGFHEGVDCRRADRRQVRRKDEHRAWRPGRPPRIAPR